MQAAYTDPINPLFNSVSPQPLYSFAAGYTHVFSQKLVNYFNPAFSWYESLFAPSNFQQTLAAFPIVLQGAAPMRPSPPSEGSTTRGCKAGALPGSSSMTIWPGAMALTSSGLGTNTRIFRLNDYDFGEGTVPTVTYTTLPQFIYGVASTATETFPNRPTNPSTFSTWTSTRRTRGELTPKLTWTIGIRDTFNSNPLNPHEQIARLSGAFDSISHDVNQPLNAVIQTRSWQFVLPPPRSRSFSRERRLPGSSRRTPCCAPGSASSAT